MSFEPSPTGASRAVAGAVCSAGSPSLAAASPSAPDAASPTPLPCHTSPYFEAGLLGGLAAAEIRERLAGNRRTTDLGHRRDAWYLAEVHTRRLYEDTGHRSTVEFAGDVLRLDRRRTRELVRVGKRLLELPLVDLAFLRREISWSHVLALVRVVVPETQSDWLLYAMTEPVRDLDLQTRLARPGDRPRRPGQSKGTPEVRFPFRVSVSSLLQRKIEDVQQVLSKERGVSLGLAQVLEMLCDVALATPSDPADPKVETRVDRSRYTLVVHDRGGDGGLTVKTRHGEVPIDGAGREDPLVARVRSEMIRCDARCLKCDGHGGVEEHVKTPPHLRARVLRRDGHRCVCCGRAQGLMVHHIRWRSRGGLTNARGLVTLCEWCHALVHAALLVCVGEHASRIEFQDRFGRRLGGGKRRKRVAASVIAELLAQVPVLAGSTGGSVEEPSFSFDDFPDAVDAGTWRRHAHLVEFEGGAMRLRPGRPLDVETPSARARPEPQPAKAAFEKVLGREALVYRFDVTARARRLRGEPFPHVLLSGAPGMGKTSIARGLAAMLGGRLHDIVGPLLFDKVTLLRQLLEMEDGDVLFLDEVHGVPRPVLEVLYRAMESGEISLPLRAGARQKMVRFVLPRVTLLAATTEPGTLPGAFTSRFGFVEHLVPYGREDLARIAAARAKKAGRPVAPEAAMTVAEASTGTPRDALRRMDQVLDEAALHDVPRVTRAFTQATFERLGWSPDGLWPLERSYLDLVPAGGQAVSLGRIAGALGLDVKAVAWDVEPRLVRRDFVRVTPRGRVRGAAGRARRRSLATAAGASPAGRLTTRRTSGAGAPGVRRGLRAPRRPPRADSRGLA